MISAACEVPKQRYDTLADLARRFGVTVEQLDDLSPAGLVQIRLHSDDPVRLSEALAYIVFPTDYIDSYAREAKK